MAIRYGLVLAILVVSDTLITSARAAEPAGAANRSSASKDSSAKLPAGKPAADYESIRSGQTRYDWKWLASRFDKDNDSVISADEFPGSSAQFTRLDRNWDGKLTADDLDWSPKSPITGQKETAFALFKTVDKNSDGRLNREEWAALFDRYAEDKDFLQSDDLERLMYVSRVIKSQKERDGRIKRQRQDHSTGRRGHIVPKPGELAPDFTLQSPDGKTTVTLSSYRGKQPVVLVFGCFTCGNYRTYSEPLEAMYKQYKDKVAFVRVYASEAHPTDDGPVSEVNRTAGILIKQPTTLEERCSVAQRCTTSLHIETPLVVDGIDNRVGKAYGCWPDRLYIVDREGKIAYTGGPGPFAFNPRELEQSLILMMLEGASK